MSRRRLTALYTVAAAVIAAAIACVCANGQRPGSQLIDSLDTTLYDYGTLGDDSIDESDTTVVPEDYDDIEDADSIFDAEMPEGDEAVRYKTLTDADFRLVAAELGVEPAAIKAVVRIEAGAKMEGFWAPGVPIINPDRSLYNTYGRNAVNRKGNPNAKVPQGLHGIALRRWTTLTNWRRVNAEGADMGTLWGMFQIGGFAYKSCGCKTIGEFVERMSRSEFDQLELFAALVKTTGYVQYICKKDWAGFARRYNGPSYARRGYHTKMASEYAKFKKQFKD